LIISVNKIVISVAISYYCSSYNLSPIFICIRDQGIANSPADGPANRPADGPANSYANRPTNCTDSPACYCPGHTAHASAHAHAHGTGHAPAALVFTESGDSASNDAANS
jgi:hypothetical protein